MLTASEISTLIENKEMKKLTFWDLSAMANKVLAKERIAIDGGDLLRASKLSLVWARIMKAMVNPYYLNS